MIKKGDVVGLMGTGLFGKREEAGLAFKLDWRPGDDDAACLPNVPKWGHPSFRAGFLGLGLIL